MHESTLASPNKTLASFFFSCPSQSPPRTPPPLSLSADLLSNHDSAHDSTVTTTTSNNAQKCSIDPYHQGCIYANKMLDSLEKATDRALQHRVAMEKEGNPRKKRRNARSCSPMNLSFSACLPRDVRGAFAESLCAVKCSIDPFTDFRESILEMIQDVGVRDWEEMEELVYCYVVLNSSDVHHFIADAFLSICSCC